MRVPVTEPSQAAGGVFHTIFPWVITIKLLNPTQVHNEQATGKFCAGGTVDACQEDSGGPLVCRLDSGQYHIAGIVSSGKGCGVYPGLYTEVSRYVDWLKYWIEKESV